MYDRVKEDNTYKRDLAKRIELINWVLEDMKNPSVEICGLIESHRPVSICAKIGTESSATKNKNLAYLS